MHTTKPRDKKMEYCITVLKHAPLSSLLEVKTFFFSFDREEQPFNLNNGILVYSPLCTVSIIRRLATRPVK